MNTGAGPGAHQSRAPVRIPHATCALLEPLSEFKKDRKEGNNYERT